MHWSILAYCTRRLITRRGYVMFVYYIASWNTETSDSSVRDCGWNSLSRLLIAWHWILWRHFPLRVLVQVHTAHWVLWRLFTQFDPNNICCITQYFSYFEFTRCKQKLRSLAISFDSLAYNRKPCLWRWKKVCFLVFMEKNCVEETANALTVKQDVYVKKYCDIYYTATKDIRTQPWSDCSGLSNLYR